MSDRYIVLHDDMTQVADAIRAKGGTTDPLVWPDGFSEAVDAMKVSDGSAEAMLAGMVDGTATEIVVPEGAASVRSSCWDMNQAIERVSLPDSVTIINTRAFYNCPNLVSVRLPEKLETISTNAFSHSSNLELATLPESLKAVNANAFYNCKKLTLSKLPDGITSISSSAFEGCEGITISKIPDGVATLSQYAFASCLGITSIVMPKKLNDVSTYVFRYSSNLRSITFLSTPYRIYATAFTNCNGLVTINVPWAEGAVANAPWGATNATINYNYTGG